MEMSSRWVPNSLIKQCFKRAPALDVKFLRTKRILSCIVWIALHRNLQKSTKLTIKLLNEIIQCLITLIIIQAMFQASKATFLQTKTPHGNTTCQKDKQCYTYNDHWYYPSWQSIFRWSVVNILAFCSVHVTQLFRTTAIVIAKAFLSDATWATYIAEVSTFATIRRQRTIKIWRT